MRVYVWHSALARHAVVLWNVCSLVPSAAGAGRSSPIVGGSVGKGNHFRGVGVSKRV